MLSNASRLAADAPSAERWNTTVGVQDLPLDSNFAWLLCSLIVVSVWLIYVTFYNSRLFGLLVTSIANRLTGDACFKVGSCSFSVLSGKLMFRDLAYITEDISCRVQDGIFIFRWWRVYVPKHVSEDMSGLDTRLSATLNGLEVHLYNRSRTYARLERLFGLSELMEGPGEDPPGPSPLDKGGGYSRWRDLVPVIKLDISTGRLVLGNRLVPTTLIVSVEEAHCVYSTKPAASQLDPFMHFVKMAAENFKVIMAPSRSYTGRRDDPPRYMGEGFVVLQSNAVDIYGYADEPGRVPDAPETERLANGDPCQPPPPVIGVEVKCGKGTDFSYGPWADRQRDALFRFFFPTSYETQPMTPPPRPGETRKHEALDIRVSTLADATMDVLFTKNQETSAIHMNMGPGSYMEITLPWVVGEKGCSNCVIGQLLHLDATTSLTYRNLLECESLEFCVTMEYPIHWNDRADWTFALTFCKATGYFIYSHKHFINDLLEDWSSSQPPDLLRFVPCTWCFQLHFKQFELVTLTNAGNWVDCSSQSPENAHLAVCGDVLDLTFDLPFTDFLPETVQFLFRVEAECLEMCLYLPEVRSSRAVLLSLAAAALVSSRDGGTYTPAPAPAPVVTAATPGSGAEPADVTQQHQPQQPPTAKWRNLCQTSAGWVDCWRVPELSLRISHLYHPMPPFGPSPQADIPTPDKEAILLSPLRAPSRKLSPHDCRTPVSRDDFCPDSLAPDVISVELELGASELYLYGSLVDNLINFKNNVFGEDESFTDMAEARCGTVGTGDSPGLSSSPPPVVTTTAAAAAAADLGTEHKLTQFDPRRYRPFKVTVAITMHDIRAHLMKSCAPGDPACPTLTLERVGFELDKSYWETRLQLLLSPVVVLARDTVPRPEPHSQLGLGHLALSGLQFRGHAMFSNRGRGLHQETVEYAWLVEVQAGELTGRLTTTQLYQTATALDTFLQLLADDDAEMSPPAPTDLCHHNTDQEICEHTSGDVRCPSSDDIKYKMLRFSLDSLDFHLVDCGTSLNLQVSPCRMSTCNLYGEHIRQGLTILLPSIALHNYVCTSLAFPATALGAAEAPALWVEAGAVRLGPVIVDLVLSCEQRRGTQHSVQGTFLRHHDDEKRRLWMLWPQQRADAAGRCGCVGGCAFFGRNSNGPRFFHPSAEDTTDGVNRAIYRVSGSCEELGYGQSLLHPGLVFGPAALSPPPPLHPWQEVDVMSAPVPLPAAAAAAPATEPGVGEAHSPPSAGTDQVDASRHFSDSGLPRPAASSSSAAAAAARGARSALSLQTLPCAESAESAAAGLARRGSRHSLASAGAPLSDQSLRAMASLTSERSEFSELYFSAASDGLSSPLPTFQTPPSTLLRAAAAAVSGGAVETSEPTQLTSNTSRQVSFDGLHTSASHSSSLSSGSFLSAASGLTGDDTPPPADLNTVDLAAQMDRPITDSPLLMASYIHHLKQVECHCWSRPPPSASVPGGLSLQPLLRRPDGSSVFSGRLFSPTFRVRREGFSHIRLVPPPPEDLAHRRAPEPVPLWERWEDEHGQEAGPVGSHSQRSANNTTLIVRLRGEVQLALTPIMLESLTRLCSTLEPALARVHPETVVGRHRRAAVSAALAGNQLKRERHLRKRVGSRSSSPRRQTVLLQRTSHHQLQAFLFLPKMSITLLQASVTEQSISFSALDEVRDLAGVSLAAVNVEGACLRLLRQRRTQRSLHILARTNQPCTANKPAKKKLKPVQVTYEPSVAETVDGDWQETMISAELGRTHCQLRRLTNDSQLLRNAVITAIPHNQGNVCFTYGGVPAPVGGDFGSPVADGETAALDCGEDKLGFNMLEVGVEQLELRTVLKKGSGDCGVGTCAGGGGGLSSAGGGGGGGAASSAAAGGGGSARHEEEPARSPQPPSAASRTDESTASEGRDRTTALHLELRAVWFNCAAPPKTALMRKADYTRSDWNMLSTFSPAIDGWLNAGNRLTASVTLMTSSYTRRQLAIMACLMTDALDLPNIHATPKSKYSVVTWLAQSVQEDPSCQLCCVLARYIQLTPLQQLESQLRARFLPETTTLKQGVLVLSRQWKNVLWMPVLVGHRFKDPPVVPCYVQRTPSRCASADTAAAAVGDDTETGDKVNMLGIPLLPTKMGQPGSPPGSGTGPASPAAETGSRSRRSLLLPLLPQQEPPAAGAAPAVLSRQTTQQSRQSVSSRPSLASLGGTRVSRHNSLSRRPTDDSCEDLYNWMARQQNYHATRIPLSEIRDLTVDSEQQPLLEVSSDESGDDESLMPPASGLQVLEAHQIFEPLLASAGVLSEVLGGETILRQLGSSVTLVAGLQTLRIDIQQSGEDDRPRKMRKQVQLSDEPAFCLTGAHAELDLRHVADTAVGEWIQRQPHAFVTRRQLKRHTQAVVNFTVCADALSLKVNMPLLRLITQLGSVYWNARLVQHGLKSDRLQRVTSRRRRRKNGSSSGSEAMPYLRSPDPACDPLAVPLSAGGGSGSSSASLFRFPPAPAPASGSSRAPEPGESPSIGRPETPRCWRTVYYLLKLYAIVPETKTVRNSCRLTTIQEQSPAEGYRGAGKYHPLREASAEAGGTGGAAEPPPAPPPTARKSTDQRLSGRELTPLVVFGVARVRRTLVEAGVSGLRLEADVRELHASLSGRKLSRAGRRGQQTSLTGHLGGVQAALHEQLQRTSQTVVSMAVGKSQCLYSTEEAARLGALQRNSALLTIGNITIDIPQHPVALHGMVTRSSAHLSITLKELRHSRSSRLVRASTFTIDPLETPQSQPGAVGGGSSGYRGGGTAPPAQDVPPARLIQPLAVHFSVVLQSLSITAALLPSLQAQYKMDTVTSMGVTGSQAKFTVDLARHDLSFRTRIEHQNLPSSASVALPQVHISADYMSEEPEPTPVPDGAEVCPGGYFSTEAEIGPLEHTLSTDLLNHLVFVQKVFMMEVNDVVQKMAGMDKFKRPLLSDEEAVERAPPPHGKGPILYSLRLTFRGIQVTATTPTNYAVRLETGLTELRLSNRYTRVGSAAAGQAAVSRLYGHAELRLNVSLGQLIRNVVFEEADAEFHQYAYFKTNIVLSNAFHDGRHTAVSAADRMDKEVVVIALRRPLVYVQPMAVDKAILVWLNYRNAYDYWSEQRRTLNKEVLTATQQVLDKVPHITQMNVTPLRSTLFLQVTVDDLGICLPINTHVQGGGGAMVTDADSRDALVITLEETAVSVMTCNSLICRGSFTGFCLRFAPDFETSLDDWKPDTMDPGIMNLCVVSEGTYEVCSHTTGMNLNTENARWVLNVAWQMEGVDIDVDISIGRHLSALASTLTTFTDVDGDGEEEGEDQPDAPDAAPAQGRHVSRRRTVSSAEATCSDSLLDGDPRKRAKVLENRMNEQARVVHELMLNGASSKVLEEETRKLEAFESVVFKDFRRDMLKKLRRQSVRGPGLGSKLSVGSAPGAAASRSRSLLLARRPTRSTATSSPSDVALEVASSEESVVVREDRETDATPAAAAAAASSVPARVTFSDTQVLLSRHASIDEADEFDEIDAWRRHSRGNQDSPAGGSSGGAPSPLVEVNNVPLTPCELDGVELRHSLCSAASPTTPKQPPAEPNIHFELDVKVFVNSGRCALHTRDPAQLRSDPEELHRDSRRRGRQHSGLSDESTPSAGRHRGPLLHSGSQTRLKKTPAPLSASIADITVVQIPGLDVKLHYDSRMVSDSVVTSPPRPGSAPSPSAAGHSPLSPPPPRRSVSPAGRYSAEQREGTPSGPRRAPLSKRASLFVWLTLQSIPTETVVSPHVLDFLDQLFELLPMSRGLSAVPTSPEAPDAAEDAAVAGPPGGYAGSFPVDVIVFFHTQPSTFRFSCLPVSKVECLLRLPSLDLVFSSKRAAAAAELTEPPSGRRRPAPMASARPLRDPPDSPAGGLSVTGVLADFSLFVFHPYGNKYTKDHATSPLNDQDRRDSLSVQVERVQFVVSRSRKLDVDSGADASKAIVRFSTVIDLGSASFKYDMRRLTEILAFPKAWYRRAIVRRLFLGDLGDTTIPAESGAAGSPTSHTSGVAGAAQSGGSQPHSPSGGTTPTRPTQSAGSGGGSSGVDVRPRPSKLHVLQRRLSLDPMPPAGAASVAVPSSWETLVLFAVNFTKLNVHMNMGNVMGNVTWQTNGFTSEGRLSIGSTGHKNMLVTLGLGGSSLEAKGGIVGGNVDVGKIDTYMRILEDPGVEPQHTLGLRLQTVELRLDYMGTSVLLGRVSALDATLRDEWRIHTQVDASAAAAGAEGTKRPATIFIHSEVSWDQLQLMISKSTTTDLLKMAAKLDEFFLQQFQSSRRVLIGLGEPGRAAAGKPASMRGRTSKQRRLAEVLQETAQHQAAADTRHHRHWHDALRMVAGLKLGTFSHRLPASGTVLGGTMEMRGNTISLACFHGLNFKAKSWALFSLRQPCISFSTESQEIENSVPPDVHVVEALSISLGLLSHQQPTARHVSMATVCRVTRTVLFPPQFRTMQEWFHYTFSTSELDEVDRFPTLERSDTSLGSGERRSSRTGQASPPPRLHDHQHTAEIVFALPPMQMHLKSEHTQTGTEPDMSAPKPLVVCSFVTEFEDHIFVTTDAENFFFLHDLIETYITRQPDSADRPRTADKTSRSESAGVSSGTAASASASGAEAEAAQVNEPTQQLQRDWRDFQCRTWHLEPTVRLLSWAGRRIEPYGVDFILNKLGFRHARTTIPKWLQRGAMDPLDLVLAVVVQRVISITREGH